MASSAAVASVSSSLAGNNDIMEDVGAKLARLSKMKVMEIKI